MRRTRAFDHADDDDPIHSVDDITEDQLHLNHDQYNQNHNNKRFQRNNHNNNNNSNSGNKGSMPLQHFDKDVKSTVDSKHYTTAAQFYDVLTSQALSLADRHKSIILGVRNLNGWIKSIGINMAISHAQDHTEQLAREIGIDTSQISVKIGPGHHGRELNSLFEMQQRADGVWDMTINPNYPLPIGTSIRLLSIPTEEDIAKSIATSTPLEPKYIPLQQPMDNIAFRQVVENPTNHNRRNITLNQRPNVYCLDLCGGKGGDLFKYMENNLGGYVLVDIAQKSVEAAIDRFNESVRNIKKKARKLFFAKFMVANLCYHAIHDYLHPRISFDMTSISFSFHYAFETESTLRGMLRNISDRLRPGSCFVCTVPDARVLLSKLKSTNELKFGNDIYHFDFKPTPQLLSWLKSQNPSTVHDYLYTLNQKEIAQNPPLLYWIKSNLTPAQFDSYFNTLQPDELLAFNEYEQTQIEYQALLDNKNLSNIANITINKTPSITIDPTNSHGIDHEIAARNPSTYDPIFSRPKQPQYAPFHSNSPFGIEYRFTLKEAVDDVPEFVVLYPVLCQIAAEYGLKPLYYENAQSFTANHFQESLQKINNRDLLNKLNVFDLTDKRYRNNNSNNDDDRAQPFQQNQWEAVGVYCSMMFQKVGEIQFQGHTLYYDDITLTRSFTSHHWCWDNDENNEEDNLDRIFGKYKPRTNNDNQLEQQEPTVHTLPDMSTIPNNSELSQLEEDYEKLSTQVTIEIDQCKADSVNSNTPAAAQFPLPLEQFTTLNQFIHPHPFTASQTTIASGKPDPYWNDYPTPIQPIPIEDMIHCFDADKFSQEWQPTL